MLGGYPEELGRRALGVYCAPTGAPKIDEMMNNEVWLCRSICPGS